MFGRLLVLGLVAAIAWAVVAHASTAAGPERAYVVRPGDTLWSIAADRYGGDPGGGCGASSSATDFTVERSSPGAVSTFRRDATLPSRNLCRSGPRSRVPRYLRLDADRAARTERAPDPARWRQAALRLRRGTQRQMLRSSVGLVELEEIFLTHYHADHFLGLPGCSRRSLFAAASCRSSSTARPACPISSKTCAASSGSSRIRSSSSPCGPATSSRAGSTASRSSRRTTGETQSATRSSKSRARAASTRTRLRPWRSRSAPSAARFSAANPSRCPTAA